MVGYLSKYQLASIRILTDEPDFSNIDVEEYDWTPLLKYVTMTHYHDANLYHNIITCQSVTGILHFFNKMPIDWFSKKQATVKTATYASEYISGWTCIDQMVDLLNTL
jgi:hypothetical protein